MNLDNTQTNAVVPKHMFDQSAEWFRVAQPREPDFAVDGLHRPSVVERVLQLFGRKSD